MKKNYSRKQRGGVNSLIVGVGAAAAVVAVIGSIALYNHIKRNGDPIDGQFSKLPPVEVLEFYRTPPICIGNPLLEQLEIIISNAKERLNDPGKDIVERQAYIGIINDIFAYTNDLCGDFTKLYEADYNVNRKKIKVLISDNVDEIATAVEWFYDEKFKERKRYRDANSTYDAARDIEIDELNKLNELVLKLRKEKYTLMST